MNKQKLIAVILFLCSFFSCNESEDEINLGNKFYYMPFQEILFENSGFGGNGIFTYKDFKRIPVIYPKVTDYAMDSVYIIVRQEFDKLNTRKLLRNMLYVDGLYFKYDKNFTPLEENFCLKTNFKDAKYSEMDQYIEDVIFKQDKRIVKMIRNKENYYIIKKDSNIITEPLTKEEFENVKRKKKINLLFKK